MNIEITQWPLGGLVITGKSKYREEANEYIKKNNLTINRMDNITSGKFTFWVDKE